MPLGSPDPQSPCEASVPCGGFIAHWYKSQVDRYHCFEDSAGLLVACSLGPLGGIHEGFSVEPKFLQTQNTQHTTEHSTSHPSQTSIRTHNIMQYSHGICIFMAVIVCESVGCGVACALGGPWGAPRSPWRWRCKYRKSAALCVCVCGSIICIRSFLAFGAGCFRSGHSVVRAAAACALM